METKEEQNQILVWVPRATGRIKYIFNLMLKDLLGLKPRLTTDAEELATYEGYKMSYGPRRLGEEVFVASDNLLFERGITEVAINFGDYRGMKCFFTTYNKDSVFPFDPFAAAFFMVSRYEEYLPFIKDKYGRFPAEESLAYKNGFLEKPVVNIWARELGKKLSEKYPQITLQPPAYRYLPTIDIDAAWAYKQKGFWRTLGGDIKNLRDKQFRDIKERHRVIRGKARDPFDSFDFIFRIHREHHLTPLFFILFADYGTNDKNTPTHSARFRQLIRRIGDYGDIGIHPSFTSNFEPEKLDKEIKLLSKVTHSEITKSRQHFLVLHMPQTYRRLIDKGIEEDYSMGFASHPGFRAGIASPFFFYDLEQEMVTSLRIFPFTYMEGTLRDYRAMTAPQALEKIKALNDEVRAVGGTCISLWHNESLGGHKRWKGWPEIYVEALEYALKEQ